MAANPAAARLTEAHRQAQNRLGAVTVAQMLASWALLDLEDLDGTFPRWLQVVVPLVGAQRRISARLAANYLTTFRALELGVTPDTLTPALADLVDARALTTSMLVTGPVAIKTAAHRGVPLDQAADRAKAGTARAAMRHALDGGRQTVTDTVSADPAAQGWARATSGKTCGFCALLASRGPVYKSKASAAGSRTDLEGRHRVHDGCNCTFEPVYHQDAAWPSGARRYQELWRDATAGLGGQDAVKAFRKAVEAA